MLAEILNREKVENNSPSFFCVEIFCFKIKTNQCVNVLIFEQVVYREFADRFCLVKICL